VFAATESLFEGDFLSTSETKRFCSTDLEALEMFKLEYLQIVDHDRKYCVFGFNLFCSDISRAFVASID